MPICTGAKTSVKNLSRPSMKTGTILSIFCKATPKEEKTRMKRIIDACKTFSDDFPQKCMYLEMCVRPKFYTEILQRLLQTSFNSDSQPVYRVEVLCLLGHKSRKDGNQQKYKELMEEAEEIYSENHAKFKTKALTEVYCLNSHVRFLSEKKTLTKTKEYRKKPKLL